MIRRATVRSLFTSRRSRRVDLEEVWCGVSRHDIAFVPGASRLMSLWKGESHHWRAFANRGGLVSSAGSQ